jgi:hypothetical protein
MKLPIQVRLWKLPTVNPSLQKRSKSLLLKIGTMTRQRGATRHPQRRRPRREYSTAYSRRRHRGALGEVSPPTLILSHPQHTPLSPGQSPAASRTAAVFAIESFGRGQPHSTPRAQAWKPTSGPTAPPSGRPPARQRVSAVLSPPDRLQHGSGCHCSARTARRAQVSSHHRAKCSLGTRARALAHVF